MKRGTPSGIQALEVDPITGRVSQVSPLLSGYQPITSSLLSGSSSLLSGYQSLTFSSGIQPLEIDAITGRVTQLTEISPTLGSGLRDGSGLMPSVVPTSSEAPPVSEWATRMKAEVNAQLEDMPRLTAALKARSSGIERVGLFGRSGALDSARVQIDAAYAELAKRVEDINRGLTVDDDTMTTSFAPSYGASGPGQSSQ